MRRPSPPAGAIFEPEPRQQARLRWRADRRFAWHWAPLRVAGRPWKIATASDPDGMLVEACRRQDRGEAGVIDPFWAAVWRAAAGLDAFLGRYNLHDQRVLELGCGTGRAGLSAALRGARVTLTDGVSDPLLLVRLTVAPLGSRCSIRRLRFGLDRLDAPPFPLILGSDVTYLRQLWPDLEQCLRDHLAPGGEVLLSDPYRLIANEFRQWIGRRPWEYEEHRVELGDDAEHPIRVMRLRLRTPPRPTTTPTARAATARSRAAPDRPPTVPRSPRRRGADG